MPNDPLPTLDSSSPSPPPPPPPQPPQTTTTPPQIIATAPQTTSTPPQTTSSPPQTAYVDTSPATLDSTAAPPPTAYRPPASDELLTVGAPVPSAPGTPRSPLPPPPVVDLSTMAPAPPMRNPASVLAAPEPDAPAPRRADPADKASVLSLGGNDAPSVPGMPGMPAKIGRYEVLRLLGEGGFGSVFLAEQKQPVKRKVALKVVKLGMDTAEVLQRFEAERQALALMDHPNVARVYDAGMTERGQPFFAMEFVEGVPLNRYIDDNELSLRMRLELFMDICRAVQHAHQKGLIHRDLKPGNIIVATIDGKPFCKVIDFGIAKATGPALSDTDTGFRTETGRLIGTPEYMSPEQCAGSVDIDTRTDVYALGVILYEMLTGQLPFDSKMLRAGGIDGITKIIREVEPPRPSAKVTQLDLRNDFVAVEKITRARKMDLRHLQRAIKGDLDWIVLKALEKDRNRRYETANALALDVQRHLDNEPVEAGPPDFRYRFSKFAQRNKVLLAASSAIAAAVLVGLIVSTTQYIRAERARAEAVAAYTRENIARVGAEASAAEQSKLAASFATENARNETSKDFFKALMLSITPQRARGRDVSIIKDVVDESITRINRGSLKDPEVEADIRSTLGYIMYSLGDSSAAGEILSKALSKTSQLPTTRPSLQFEILNRLALAEQANNSFNTALDHYQQALQIAIKTRGEKSIEAATVTQNIGLLNMDIRRFGDAVIYLRRSLETFTALGISPDDPRFAIVQNNLAASYHSQGDYKAAETEYRKALATLEAREGTDSPITASAVRNLALVVYDASGAPPNRDLVRLAEAEALLARAVSIWKKVLPPDHPDYRQVLDLRGDALTDLGRLDEALVTIRESLAIREKYIGLNSRESLQSLANLTNIFQRQNQLPQALELSIELLSRAQSPGGLNPNSPEEQKLLASYLSLRGTLLLDSGHPDQAEPLIQQSYALRSTLFGVGEWPRANSQSLMGACLAAQGKYKEAEPLLFEAYQLLKNNPDTPEVTTQRARNRLKALYEATNRHAEADKLK